MAPRTLPGSMTARQFDVAAKRAGLSPLLRARARRVLVDAEQPADVAKSDGISRAAVLATLSKLTRSTDADERIWPAIAPPPPKR